MEMPEGWIKLRKVALLESDKANPKFTSCFVNGLDLMKEMAEALEKSIDTISHGGPFVVGDEIQKVLQKFKNWK